MKTTALEKAIHLAGGQSSLGRLCGLRQGHVWNWLNREGRVPAENVLVVCAVVDWQITPHELRPDIYPNPSDGLPGEKRSGEAA